MLSATYKKVKILRSNGDCAGAIALLRKSRPNSDYDGFEAVVCLLICGDVESAVNVCRTYAWNADWASKITAALAETLVGGDATRALSLARAAIAYPDVPLDASAAYVLVLQKNNLVDEADAYITRRWDDPPAGETFLLTMMAEIAVATKNWRQAFRCASAVLAADPDDHRALVALSVANYEDGNLHEALGNARRAHALNAGFAPSILQIMRCQNKLGDHYAAVAAFEALGDKTAIAADFHIELAKAYAGAGQRTRAIEAYRAALATLPPPVEAVRELAAIYAADGNSAGIAALAQAHPSEMHSDVDALYWWGLERLGAGDLKRARDLFSESHAVGEKRGDALADLPWPVPEPRLRHDYEQLALLDARGKLNDSARRALNTLKPYFEKSVDPRLTFAPSGPAGDALKRALGAHHYSPDVRFEGCTLGDNDYGAIEKKYFAERLAVIDRFLSPEALVALRTFCEEATVWKQYNRHGYVGALLAQGFSPPVLLSIAAELRRALPRVIGDQPLLQAWGFKYDQRMHGIRMHADFAKVNVNFWITPDAACADPSTGGMVVYDIPVPKSWTFAQYNSDPERLEAYVKLHDAKPLRVPYRENRCVLFDSSLIHVTDEMRFKPGYENRRTNITLLYGQGLSVE
jgi:tetratricopeptide (TPR) repeat protein